MVKGIYTAARGLGYKLKNIESVANNLANISSTGYKREGTFAQIIDEMGKTRTTQTRDYSDGNLVNTNNTLDLAIRGDGFFEIKTENGLELSRNGKFTISESGYLVNGNGDKVMGARGEINLSGFKMDQNQVLQISRNGEIKVGDTVVDTIKVSTVDDPQTLEKSGGSNFTNKEQEYISVDEDKFQLLSGYLEESNVNPIYEMQKMIEINKEYESAQKIINTIDLSLDRLKEIGKV